MLDGDSVRLVKIETAKGESRGDRAVRLLRSGGPIAMSTDEIMG